MSRQLRLDVAQLTDVGRKRPHNEDNMAYVIPKDEQVMARKGALFIVADGMGGHAAGEVASEIAVETVTVAYYQDETEDIPLSLMNAIKRANTIIHQRSAENMLRSGMGTTCVSAVLRGNVAYIANVGDSRAYIIRRGQVRQISQDHSWVEEQVRAGLLTRDQARSHAQRNVITRCLGTQAEVEVDVFSEALEEGDTLLLCTDGLSGLVAENDLRAIVEQYIPQESVYHLVERANENGGSDNITAIVVRVQELGVPEQGVSTRQLVPVGALEEGDGEDTMVLGRAPSAPLSGFARSEDGRATAALPRASSTAPFQSSQSGTTAPMSSLPPSKRNKHPRMLYPTLALVFILLVTFAGGGAYYFLYLQRDVNQRLDATDQLIRQAATASDPTKALQDLASAQNTLKEVSKTILVGPQSGRVSDLQVALTTNTRKAITEYNQRNKILSLVTPCDLVHTAPVTTGAIATKSMILAEIQDASQAAFPYVLSGDTTVNDLYELDAKNTLSNKKVFDQNAHPILVTAHGSSLFAVTVPEKQNGTPTYKLFALKRNADGSLGNQNDHAPRELKLDTALLSSNRQPQLITAWGDDIYIFFYSRTSSEAVTIQHYTLKNWNSNPESTQIQVSFALRSAVALPNKQLVFLTSDGGVQRMQFVTANPGQQQITLQDPVPAPVGVDAQAFAWNTPFNAPLEKSTQSPFLSVPQATQLLTGKIANTIYLFIVDDSLHRVIQLSYNDAKGVESPQTPSATATPKPSSTAVGTQSPGGGIIPHPYTYVRQFVFASSNHTFPEMKSVALNANNGQLQLLTRQGATVSLTSIDTTTTASACSSAK